ncbi:MAG: diguanylate cyclase [Actinomycetota bacterium]|nr:diguanylate cyclase [Actinomycetota bacterium]
MATIEELQDGGAHGLSVFRFQIAALVGLYTIIVFGALYLQARSSTVEALRSQGESYFYLVVTTRAWNSQHGGVWVEKRPAVETNPYLAKMGIPADLRTENGVDLTLRNPSAMTREVSELTDIGFGVTFHLTGKDPVNPGNAPDSWEHAALDAFEAGESSAETFDRTSDTPVFRYMEPLIVEESCFQCHGEQGYKVGDVRGGLSISIPTKQVDDTLRKTATNLGMLAILTLGVAVAVSQAFVTQLRRRLDVANSLLSSMAVTDDLTGVANRRAIMARLTQEFSRSKRSSEPLSLVALDIDRFKRINDQHGHAVGDAVLKEVAARMGDSLREYDGFGRTGGEEFLVIAPETDSEAALRLAERVISQVHAGPVSVGDLELTVTASAGVATIDSRDERGDDLLARTDLQLYRAKAAGRDCARAGEPRKA